MVKPPIQEELASCLEPYEAVLERRATVLRLESYLWIHGSHTGDADEDRTLMETLELFALLARVDWRMWINVIAKLGRSLSTVLQLNDAAPERVGVSFKCSARWSQDLCEYLVTSCRNSTSSALFHASKKLMLRACYDQGNVIDEVPMRIGRDDDEWIEAQLANVSQLVSRQQQACREAEQAAHITTEPFYRGLRFREVEIGQITRLAYVTILGYAGEIASCGVILSDLRPALVQVQREHPHEFTNAMMKIFPDHDPSETQTVGGVRYWSIPDIFDAYAYPAFLSAVRVTSSVRKIDFTSYFGDAVTADQKRWLWSWLVYGAFSKQRGLHSIQEITLNMGGLYKKAIERVTRILLGANPVATLFNREGDDVPPETVSASQFALLDPSSPEGMSVAKWICDHPLDDLSVIDRTTDWVSVLLPRWGQAWVHRHDVLSSQLKSGDRSPHPVDPPRHTIRD